MIRRLIAWARQVNWSTEPAVIMGVIKAVLAALAGAGLTVTDHQVAAVTAYVTAGCLILAAFITRAKVSSPATTDKLKARLARAAIASVAGKQTEDDPAITSLIDRLGKARMALNPAGDHPQYKLGRRINHDPRSRQFALPEPTAGAAYQAKRWARAVPVFDQGQVGSCTANAACGWLVTDDSARKGETKLADGTAIDEKLCLKVYSDAETIDGDGPYPPNDNGSSGVSVAKVLKNRGLCASYLHAFSIAAVYAALQNGPGMAGTTWFNSMFTPAADGRIPVDKKSGVAGGHEYLIDELEVDSTGAVTKLWITNSWGTGWGIAGRGYFTPADFTALLADAGDFTQPAPVVVPAPTPAPVPVPPDPSGDEFAVEVARFPKLGAALDRLAAEKGMTRDQYSAWRLAGDTRTR